MKLSAKVLMLSLMLLSLYVSGPLERVSSQGGTALASANLSVSLTFPTKDNEFDFIINSDTNLQPCIDEPAPFANGDCRITAPPNFIIFDDGGDGKPNGYGIVFGLGFPGAALAHADVPASMSTFLDSTRTLTYASNDVIAAATKATTTQPPPNPPIVQGGKAYALSCGDSQTITLVNLTGSTLQRTISGRYKFQLFALASAGTATSTASFRVIDDVTGALLFQSNQHQIGAPPASSLNSCDIPNHVIDSDPPNPPDCAVPFNLSVALQANAAKRIRITQACAGSTAVQEVTDNTKPSCTLTSKSATGIGVTARDLESGLAAINVLISDNAHCSNPPFTPGTTAPVVVTCTKDDLSKSARVELQVLDMEGNITTCDPVLTLLEIPEGSMQTTQTFQGIPHHEHYVTIQNGAPGMKQLRIQVNGGHDVMLKRLEDDEIMTVDVSSLMVEGNNTIALTGYGDPGASALIIISDSGEGDSRGHVGENKRRPNKKSRLLPGLLQRNREMLSGINMVWGKQVER